MRAHVHTHCNFKDCKKKNIKSFEKKNQFKKQQHKDKVHEQRCVKLYLLPTSCFTAQRRYSNTLSNAVASQELKAHLVKETKSRASQGRNRWS